LKPLLIRVNPRAKVGVAAIDPTSDYLNRFRAAPVGLSDE
jgi:hypothetical protein